MEIKNIQDIYYLLTSISATVILTLSCLLACVHQQWKTEYRKFNLARIYLALSYFILGIAGIISCNLPRETTNSTELLLITLSVASFQSLLFTSTHIIFIQPDSLNRKHVFLHLFFIIIGILSFSICYKSQILQDGLLQLFFIIPYLVQQVYYTYKFRQIHQRCVQQMENYYDEEQNKRLKWLNYSFYSALSVGLFSLIASLTGLWMYTIFTILYTLFYTYMVVLFFNHRLITIEILPAVTAAVQNEPALSESPHEENEISTFDNQQDEEYYLQFQQHLKIWISEKGYLQKDLSVDDIASLLQTDRDYLRYYFRTYIHSDFRTWRSVLRINEAKRIMKEHPEYSFSKIAEFVGFNHRANFFNQFQKIEGMTPSEWKRKEE